MIGDQSDVLSRIKAALPPWFGSNTPNLNAVMSGPANVLAAIYSLIQYAELQTRIQTSTDGWLDLTAQDFFGRGLQRRTNEPDATYSARILKEIIRKRVTRSSVSNALVDLTGIAPIIFEPARIADTGALGVLAPQTFALGGSGSVMVPAGPSFGVGMAMVFPIEITMGGAQSILPFSGIGAWGSLNYPDQFFITAYRPPSVGVPNAAGLTSVSQPTSGGGYGSGSLEYVSLTNINGPITDAEIYATIARNIAAGVTAWTQITAFNGLTPANLLSWLPLTIESDAPSYDTSADPSVAFVKATPF